MKHIGIDCRFWSQTGIGRYTQNIVGKLAEMDNENEYTLFFLNEDIHTVSLPDNFKKVSTDIKWYTFKEQLVLPFIFYKYDLDVLFVPNLNVPVLYFKRFVVTLHDLTHIKIKTGRASTLPYPLYLAKRMALKLPLFYSAKFAYRIFTVSEHVKEDIVKTLHVKPEKVLITVNAVSENFRPEPDEKVQKVLSKYNVKKPYLFYVGNAHPHKNLERLINAFELVHAERPDLTLVLGGKKNFFYERLQNEVGPREIYKSLIFTDFIDDANLPALYTGAEAFVNPSLEEGFGIQILEAFACGTKVICSNTSSLPEVGGNIAYYFNPGNIHKMAEAILLGLRDENPKRIEAGFERIKDFSWENSAKIVHGVLTS